jgi:hypothetical protein
MMNENVRMIRSLLDTWRKKGSKTPKKKRPNQNETAVSDLNII